MADSRNEIGCEYHTSAHYCVRHQGHRGEHELRTKLIALGTDIPPGGFVTGHERVLWERARLRTALRVGIDLVEASLAHVSHGGPTRADAEKWVTEVKQLVTDSILEESRLAVKPVIDSEIANERRTKGNWEP